MLSKKSKIFIAGHNGMVGSSILRHFKSKNYNKIYFIEKKNLIYLIRKKFLII